MEASESEDGDKGAPETSVGVWDGAAGFSVVHDASPSHLGCVVALGLFLRVYSVCRRPARRPEHQLRECIRDFVVALALLICEHGGVAH